MPNTTTIYEWNNLSQPLQQLEWKSKVFVTKEPINMGAARVVADYPAVGNTATNWEAAVDCWGISTVGPAPAPATTLSWNALSGLTFKLWVNKQLVMTRTVVNSRVFRMPTGYKSDTFEVSVEGDVRVRAIHLAETPTALENV